MRWYEYKMEVDDLHASDDLKAKLLALQANAAETPGAKSIAMPAPSPTPKKQKKPLRFPARRWAQLAACVAVCGVCLYGAVYAYEWKGVTLLGGGSSSNYSAAATKAAAPQAAVYSMEDTENATYGSADNGISSFSAEDGHRSADTAAGGSLLTSGEAESDASARTADSAKIIYTANLTLETRDYDTARAALDAALSDADGYMESSSEYTNTDSTRSVSLTLRVPQDSYKSFLAAAAQSGSVTYQNQQGGGYHHPVYGHRGPAGQPDRPAHPPAGAAGPGRHPGRPVGDRVQPERCAVPDRKLAEPAGLVQQSGLLLHRLYHPERGGDPDPHQHQLRRKAAGRPAQWLDRLRVRRTGRGGVPCGRMARHPHRRGLRRDLLPCPPSQKEKVKNFSKTLDIHPPLWYYT